MKQTLISFSSLLLVLSLLAGVTDATENTSITGMSSLPEGINTNGTLLVNSTNTASSASVANLRVADAHGDTQWSFIDDYPALYVSWDANTEENLAAPLYDVFISDFKPNSLGEMEKIKSTSDISSYIEIYGGKPLEYGKDYWVAVAAPDNAGNYADCFAICGPVQTYSHNFK